MLSTNSVFRWEPTLECSATHHFTLRRATDLSVSQYQPILFPTGNLLWSAMLLIYSLSGREQIFLYRGTTQFSFPLGIYFEALCYLAVLSPAGTDLSVSRYQPILFPTGNLLWSSVLLSCSLPGCEQIILCLVTNQFSFPLGIYFGALCYPPVLSLAGNRSCNFALHTNSLSDWETTLESCTSH